MSEELLVRHCSPTLTGIKTGNMFNCPCASPAELTKDIRALNRRLTPKGLRILPLRVRNGSALIYVFRPSRLKRDLENGESLLKDKGYSGSSERCVVHLINRLNMDREFPHEIGLFLGYPPEDVRGFLEKGPERCKFTGCWKVYGDEERARRLFKAYKSCTEFCLSRIKDGCTIEGLTATL